MISAHVRHFQHALFACQKWHLRCALSCEQSVRRFDRFLAQRPGLSQSVKNMLRDSRRVAVRKAHLHRRFIDAITPFVQSPLP